MRFRSGMIFALTVSLALGGCAAAATAGGGPSASPTGRVYEPGTRPTQTRFSQAATLSIAQGRFPEALAQAQEGIAAEPGNPIHYFLAGEAAVGVGNYALADSLWIRAEEIFPAYELEIEPSRENAWANAFNEGVEAYSAGNARGAIEAWRRADLIYRLRPEAAQNLAILLSQEGEYDEAVRIYRRGLESIDLRPGTRILEEDELAEREETRAAMRQNLAQLLLYTDQFAEAESLLRDHIRQNPNDIEAQASLATALTRLGRESEATEIYTRLLTAPNLPATELFNIGVALFQADDFVRAAGAFGRVTQAIPDHRDAWFNQANALYAAESWQELVPVAERLRQLDPLNQTSALILTRAYRELGRNQDALATLERIQAVPVFIEDLEIRPGTQQTVVTGRVIGHEAGQGTPVRLRFTFYGDTGQQVGTETVTINAPAREVSQSFEVRLGQQASAYRYEVL